MSDKTTGARVVNLKKSFGNFEALPGLSFEVKPGEFMTLLGPSGCGKTTALRCIAGLENPDSGEIWVGDRMVAGSTYVPAEKRNIGMVFQNYAIWPHMTVFDNLAYGLRLRKRSKTEVRERVMGTLEMLGMAEFAPRYGTELSGGQQQRVAIGRCLVLDSDLFLFDEPLSNLDAKLRERLRFELKEIQTKFSLTAIYVTHDQTEAMVLSDRVILMNKGQLVQQGPPRELYQRPRNLFVAKFFGEVNLVKGKVTALGDGLAKGRIDSVGDVRFRPLYAIDVGSDIVLAVRPEDVRVDRATAAASEGFGATIERGTYLGNHSLVAMRVGPYEFNATCAVATEFRPGEQVRLSVAPNAWLHIEADEAASSGTIINANAIAA